MNPQEWKRYRRDALFGALGALLMLVGDLCLSVIPASPGDSGLFAREAYLNGSWEQWRLPLLVATGLCGMALGFFTVRMSYRQILPQYRKTRAAVLAGGVIYIATAGALHFFIGSLADLDKHAFSASRTGRNNGADRGAVCPSDARDVHCLRGNGFADSCRCLCIADKENRPAAVDVCLPYDRFSGYIRTDSRYPPGARGRCFHMGFCPEPGLGQRGTVHLDDRECRLCGQAGGNAGKSRQSRVKQTKGDRNMSKKATEFQKKEMSRMYRGKEIFKPLNTGWIDENVACVREWVANIFFYRKGDTTIMIDAGYNYDRLAEKMAWLGIHPKSVHHILITHQDTDHVGAVEADSPGLFRNARLYIGETENRYLTGEVRRKVIYHLYKLPQVTINNRKQLLKDGETLRIGDIKIKCFLVPGHTWGHMVYLVDDRYLFTGDTLWFGADGGYSFISTLAENNKLAVKSLAILETKLKKLGVRPLFITGHTGWTDNFEFAFAHKDKLCSPFRKRAHDPTAPYDAYDESDDTEEGAKSGFLKGVVN